MGDYWQLQEAKSKLSQLVQQARAGHPQTISVHGREAVVILSAQEYRRLRALRGKLSDALLMPEIAGEDLDFSRSQARARDMEL
jgi:prevent-host-death family protein